MDKQDSLKTILNHLLDTAVYVIRQDSHGILYFNDRVKTVTPDIALGQVCHDVWEGSCENCPLKTMDGKQSNTTLSFDDPFGEVVSITATEMMWEEDIPAYVISVTPQVKTKKEQEFKIRLTDSLIPENNGYFLIKTGAGGGTVTKAGNLSEKKEKMFRSLDIGQLTEELFRLSVFLNEVV